jgi:hypothetical protein
MYGDKAKINGLGRLFEGGPLPPNYRLFPFPSANFWSGLLRSIHIGGKLLPSCRP